ncbi:MAG: hypothetical protein P4M00_00965 [Azospirillaceae bacterium]|nr:hypothetical protein [Azospirillaceae bacterium]
MSSFLDVPVPVFIGLTIILFGGAAFMAGQAAANSWRPAWNAALNAALLGLGDRFLCYALFDGPLLTLSGYLIHTAVLMLFCFAAYRMTLARNMVVQYPWLYERSGLFGWRALAS